MRVFKGIPISGKKLSKLRDEELFFTQEELAPRIGMTKNNLSAIERQSVAGMNRDSFRKLAELRKVHVGELRRMIGATEAEIAASGNGVDGSDRPSPAHVLAALESLARAHPAIRLVDALALVKDDRGGMPLREAAMPVPKGGMDMPGGKKK